MAKGDTPSFLELQQMRAQAEPIKATGLLRL